MASNITNRQLMTIFHIIASSSMEEVCRKAKLSKGTLYAWLKEDAFRNELKRQRDEVIGESLNKLKYAMTQAIDGLVELMASPRPDLRRWVCKDIIDYAFKRIEIEDIETRLERIEQSLGGDNVFKKKVEPN